MTKKVVLSTSFLFVAVALTACIPGLTQTPENSIGMNQNDSEETLAAAMMTGAPLRCTIVNTEEGDTIEYVTKDKKMRVKTMQEQISYVINDGSYMYIWNDGETTGVKSRIPTEEEIAETQELAQNAPQNVPDFSQDTVQEEYEEQGYTIDCQEGIISDSEFVPPTTVMFQDTSAMMDSAIEAMKKLNESN